MTDLEQRQNAKKFVDYWKNHSKKEKQDDQTFWNMFLRDILGVQKPETVIKYQAETDSSKINWIDAWIKSTGVIIEQKSGGVDLLERTKQKDGSMRNAYEQAKNYDDNMNKSNKSNWIVTCNFDKFLIYDMNDIKKKYIEINLEDLPSCYDNFNFLVNKGAKVNDMEVTVSKEAGKIIGNIYNEIEFILISENALNDLNKKYLNEFCVRLVFCCFAEDAGLFAKRQFRDFIERSDISHLQSDLLDLFEVLNTKERRTFLREDLNAFPYVNGELFSDKIDIPPLNEKIKTLILEDACDGFDWSKINPTIFGAIFESTLNPETRRSGGMHYTSIENIHKVIDPLFLDELKNEFSDIRKSSQINVKKNKLENLQKKLSSLIFLDPACGSGNFLTETYLELRRLENNILRELVNLEKGQRTLFYGDVGSLIKVHIQQFYGIEINDFAVAVSKTALWIAEYQMYLDTMDLYNEISNEFLPLDSYENIVLGNALRIDWNDVVPNFKCNYIMGNPPFVGARKMKQGGDQKAEIRNIFYDVEAEFVQDLDYVCGWYAKAGSYIMNSSIKVGFVSTNSICQGVQATILWKWLYSKFDLDIIYAYASFEWESEANDQAVVDCVIIGFAAIKSNNKMIFEGTKKKNVNNINQYLLDGPTVFIESSRNAMNGAKKMNSGNQPRDGGNFVIKEDEYEDIKKYHPEVLSYLYPYIGADEFIKNKKRWCLWLKGVSPDIINNNTFLKNKVKLVYNFRINSTAKTTNGYAKVPEQFAQITQPLGEDYIIIPSHTTSNRKYIPIGFLSGNTISSNAVSIIPNASLYDFGILTSNVHMAWMRIVCGRLGNGYRYSKEIVYNNFPWPNPTAEQKHKIEKTAQAILDARNLYPDSSLAKMYGEIMFSYHDLVKAHQENDKAVMKAYGFSVNMSESEIVAKLMEMYQKLVEQKK